MDIDEITNLQKAEEIKRERLLVEAAEGGYVEDLENLLRSGVSVNAEEYNKTLFYASKNYMTPLQKAAANGNVKCLKLLIEHGADVNARDRFDVTAVHMAAENGHYLCLKALLDANAECCLPTKYSKKGYYTAVPHLGGTTPLHLAASNNHVACVKELIHFGADYNAVDERGRTSLYIAAQLGYSECVVAHLKNAVGRDILSLPGLETGDTPLHFAVRRGMVECVRLLLNSGSDVNHVNHEGSSPLHVAVMQNVDDEEVSMEILQLLVLNGYNTDINLTDGSELTPLHYVCFSDGTVLLRRPKMAKFLISYGANVYIKNYRGYNLIECEFRSSDKDLTILKMIAKSVKHLPLPSSLNLTTLLMPSRSLPLVAHHFAPLHHGFGRGFGPPPDLEPPQIDSSVFHQKLDYYLSIARKPRTLQHYSRYAIRSALGYRRLRHIKDLPIPHSLQKYLLLEYDE